MAMVHGVLYINVKAVRNIPGIQSTKSRIKSKFCCSCATPKMMTVSTYVTCELGDVRIAKTRIIKNSTNPVWEEQFRIDLAHIADDVTFRVKSTDLLKSADLGLLKLDSKCITGEIPVGSWTNIALQEEIPIDPGNPGWFYLAKGESGKANGSLMHINLKFYTVESLRQSPEVPGCYFPLRNNCEVVLYQDAHTPPNPLHQNIQLADGSPYEPSCAFNDLFDAIAEAKRFIYITGWSLWTETVLKREDSDDKATLGDLLVKKTKEGVCVLGLVWDEKTSTQATPGLMGTHDEETAKYFSKTQVLVALVMRSKEKADMLKNQFVSTCYTHHQKTVIVDAENPSNPSKRRILAFVGGLDLTSGRYDSPEHSLFSTLKTHHEGDFYNGCATVSDKCGPRQPWHDIHSKFYGKAAHDVRINFEERWRKQAPEKDANKLLNFADPTLDIESVDAATADTPDNSWSVQVFRSITSDSAQFLAAYIGNLTKKASRLCDDSIHRAYVHHIRRAKRFLYIENQYFLGSTQAWRKQETKALHLIPLEIASKICEKIENGERFTAYIIIPLFPEGDPTSAAIQEILYWQRRTIEMMYTKVALAIQKMGLSNHPTDYLNFYCLGKREAVIPDDIGRPQPNSQEEKLQKSRRFMVYVHSKMMIVDDETIIVGSANINQRSMGGTRDTEIAMSASQPMYTVDNSAGVEPKGMIYAFRMALWAEHTATVDSIFHHPTSLGCVRAMNTMAKKNWSLYSSNEVQNTNRLLMQYPIQISSNGDILNLPDCETFPDTTAKILGAKSTLMFDKLTT